MDVYHKVLIKLYEVTGGKDTQTVDFKELVKAQGFHGNYDEIFQMLNGQGWIVETPKANYVKISHWGVKEAKKSASGDGEADDSQELKKTANRLIKDTKEFVILLEEFASDASKEKFGQVEKKFGELNSSIAALKENV
ncbi:MAG: hypothetical protein WA584_14010 [Pyrinomonadaceae bacterium]